MGEREQLLPAACRLIPPHMGKHPRSRLHERSPTQPRARTLRPLTAAVITGSSGILCQPVTGLRSLFRSLLAQKQPPGLALRRHATNSGHYTRGEPADLPTSFSRLPPFAMSGGVLSHGLAGPPGRWHDVARALRTPAFPTCHARTWTFYLPCLGGEEGGCRCCPCFGRRPPSPARWRQHSLQHT